MTQRQAKKLLRGVPFVRRSDHPRLLRALSKNFRAYHRYLKGDCRRFKWGTSRFTKRDMERAASAAEPTF